MYMYMYDVLCIYMYYVYYVSERLERLAVNAKVATVRVRFKHPSTQWNQRGGR
jgi:hypothetical protein